MLRWNRVRRTEARGEGVDGAQRSETISRPRARLQALLAVACACGVFVGVHLSRLPKSAPAMSLTEQALAGTWELQSLNGAPVGDTTSSAILSQQVTFRNGILHGETRLRADSEAATLAMPFPDTSVAAVRAAPDGHDVTVTWNGSYRLLRDGLAELTVGKATYCVEIKADPQTHTLRLDHDAVLTYPGATRYLFRAAQTPKQTALRP